MNELTAPQEELLEACLPYPTIRKAGSELKRGDTVVALRHGSGKLLLFRNQTIKTMSDDGGGILVTTVDGNKWFADPQATYIVKSSE